MKWATAFLIVSLVLWQLFRHLGPNLEGNSSPPTMVDPVDPKSVSMPALLVKNLNVMARQNDTLTESPATKTNTNIPAPKLSSAKHIAAETKKNIHFLNEHESKDIKTLIVRSKPWDSLPLIGDKHGLATLICGAGDVRFKKGFEGKNWRIILDANYRGYVDSLENFGKIAILENGVLKSLHTSDEAEIFLGDPKDLNSFIIRASKIIYLQLFSIERGPDDEVKYVYAGNLYSQNKRTKAYQRIGIVLMRACKDDDLNWSFGNNENASVDKLSLVNAE